MLFICCSITLSSCDTSYVSLAVAVCYNTTTKLNHRLNGSSSPVLTATSISIWGSQKFDPHRIKTPDPIEIKFGMVDSVSKRTHYAKFYANPSKGASGQL